MTAPPMDVGDVAVDAPPDVPRAAPANPLARLLPLVMLVAVGGMAALYFTSGATSRGPTMLLFPAMMAVSALGSVVYGMRGTRRSAELNEDRRRYLRYLDALDDAAVRTARAQRYGLHWRHPEPSALWSMVGGPRTWERRPGDDDFGHVRVGVGTLGLSTTLVAPRSGPADDFDPVTADAVERLLHHRSTVDGLPIAVDLTEHRRVSVRGDIDSARATVRAVLCQLATFHHPGDLRIVTVSRDATAWEWLKWLPHQGGWHRRLDAAPRRGARHVVVVSDGGEVGDAVAGDGVTVVELASDAGATEVRILLGDRALECTPDGLAMDAAIVCARRIASLGVRAVGSRSLGWADLLGIGDPSELDPVRTWQPRLGARRLRVPVGVAADGTTVELDLKEAAHGGMGPHGLCVGATGSGKSELLRTLALGLVATHSPDALNLALVDFKGGATFRGFEQMRHVAAVITNLADEAHLVARMRDALAGEMNRRQELLRAAGNFASITDYEHARTTGVALAPLPTLLIIVDEFSELLTQQPDLAELFVAIGRVGRSLGMHLLLASQRLDEGRLRGLESHLSYRIALKTFSAAESRAVLGTADAYELPNRPGMAFLKTADGNLVGFRAAYVAAPAAPSTAPRSEYDGVPALFTAAASPFETPQAPATSGSLLDVVVDRLSAHGRRAHAIWSPPLTTSPDLGELLAVVPSADTLTVPIGLVDRPFEQRRDALVVDLGGSGGNVAVVGGPRSGKSTTLCTLALALAATRSPARAQVYGLDFGGGDLTGIRALPHVGSVADRFEADLAQRIVSRVHDVVRRRQSRLRNGSGLWEADDDHGHVFLLIDGWATARREFEVLETSVTELAGQGLAVGVHVVIAASRWADLRPALKDQLGTRIELRLGDPAESEMHRAKAKTLVGRPAGRGITQDGLELAIARPRLDAGDGDAALATAGVRLAERYPGVHAAPVRLLPARVDAAEIDCGRASSSVVPIGIGDDDLQPLAIDFGDRAHLVVIGEPGCGKTSVLRTLSHAVARDAEIVVVDPRRALLGVLDDDGATTRYAASGDAARAHVADLAAMLRGRFPGPHVTQRQLRERSWWSGPDAWVIVDDYDLVADAASGNPLAALLDLIPHATDLGLHVVIARRSGGAARAMFDPVLARLRDLGAMGLMMSARPDDGPLFGALRPSPQPPGRGVLVRPGSPDRLVQVAWTEPP
ncbi:type VII secretion protein EccCa [Mycolicibacterium lacusdiani]|uniref:type VII secretion protein EccCa n=1 Tax=Mycolicibacterium lacusdiani TaxID=2895283 RepID=UPI001F026FFC|nr:type VII secretion protein EccCa [Mycolicibacterium lacusdiani]